MESLSFHEKEDKRQEEIIKELALPVSVSSVNSESFGSYNQSITHHSGYSNTHHGKKVNNHSLRHFDSTGHSIQSNNHHSIHHFDSTGHSIQSNHSYHFDSTGHITYSEKPSPSFILQNKKHQMQKQYDLLKTRSTSLINKNEDDDKQQRKAIKPTTTTKNWLQDYNEVNQAFTDLYHYAKVYNTYCEQIRKSLNEYKQSVQMLSNAFTDNIKEQVDLELESKFNQIKEMKLSPEERSFTALQQIEITSKRISYLKKQTELLSEHLDESVR